MRPGNMCHLQLAQATKVPPCTYSARYRGCPAHVDAMRCNELKVFRSTAGAPAQCSSPREVVAGGQPISATARQTMASQAASVAQYVQKHDLSSLIEEMTNDVVREQPDDPLEGYLRSVT